MNISRVPTWATPGTVAARVCIWCFVIYSLWQGVGIIVGGAGRWSGPAYTYLLKVPYAPESWGWAIIFLGMLLGAASLTESWWLKAAALVGMVTWSLGFSVGAQLATVEVATAGTTGGPVYLLVACIAATLIAPDEARKAV